MTKEETSMIRFVCTACVLFADIAVSQGRPDFGDNSGMWASDGECDDPRFSGEGMASVLLDEDAFRDAADCESLYDQSKIRLVWDGIRGALGIEEKMHEYYFEVPSGAGHLYQIDLRSEQVKTVLTLYQEAGEEPVAVNDDYPGSSEHSHIKQYLLPGKYRLEVSSYEEGDGGSYLLNVNQLNHVQLVSSD